jgi:hypothetical protein
MIVGAKYSGPLPPKNAGACPQATNMQKLHTWILGQLRGKNFWYCASCHDGVLW